MKKQEQICYIMDKLTYFELYIKNSNKSSFTDINIIAEGFMKNLLNKVLSLDLKNLNEEQPNYPSVDLGDFSKKIAVQITSQNDSKKIIETYNNAFKTYPKIGKIADVFSERIYFIILNGKKSKFQNKALEHISKASHGRFCEDDVLDLTDIIKKILSLYDNDYERFYDIYNLISQTIDELPEIPTDKIVIEEILKCFNRPAFTIAFVNEWNFLDLDNAIRNTISLINTGKSCDGIQLEYNVNDVNRKKVKRELSEIVAGLNQLRKIFSEMQKRGYACEYNYKTLKHHLAFNNDTEFCNLMNELRLVILSFAKKLAESVQCDFNVFPTYTGMNIEINNTDILTSMEKVYLYYNSKL